MKIGMDAKRAFHNQTGLGNYSRTLIKGLATYYPEHEYYLFNPKPSRSYPKADFPNVHEVLPQGFLNTKLSSLWRSNWVKKDLLRMGIQLYHGLSHEIPVGIERTGIPSVVTIHDLIFERYPEQFSKIDVQVYRKKFRYACNHSNRIIAISRQTKSDIMELYGIAEEKIDVCYQSCHPAFGLEITDEEKGAVRKRYGLPQEFFLYVGSIIERKNLLNICKALQALAGTINIPLLVIGNGREYKQVVQEYVKANNLEERVIFLSDREPVRRDAAFQHPETFAAIYQMAVAMIYPSFFEGFGIPVLEALWSRLPVITSNVSCLPETGGDAAYYVSPGKPEEIAEGMRRIYEDASLREEMMKKGWNYAQNFTLEKCTRPVMDVYKTIVHGRTV
ncbi:MAG TPA: glycosyltransferase family 1 protein [Chitinophagaceae bacterium]